MKRLFLLVFLLSSVNLIAQTQKPSGPLVYRNQNNIVIRDLVISNTPGNGIELWYCDNVTIENCTIKGTIGNGVNGFNTSHITIRNCTFSENATGVYVSTGVGIVVENCKFQTVNGPRPRGQFVQLNYVTGAGNRIACNYMESIFGQGDPEDAINTHASSGTAASPIIIENNYVKGGGPSQSGGGILLGDGGGSYMIARNNVLVNPGQYGMAIVSGHDMQLLNNKVYGEKFDWSNVGMVIWQYSDIPCNDGHKVMNNKVYWINRNGAATPFWTDNKCSNPTISGNEWQSSGVSKDMAPPSCAGLSNAPATPSNQTPTVQSGASQTITLPTNSVTLKGTASDADGTIASWKWTIASGPGGGTIKSPNTAQTDVTGLIEGAYKIVLTVTDNSGAQASDELYITVNAAPAAAPNQAPTVQSGASQTLTLPTNKATLKGTATDADGTIASWKWTIESGPGVGAIASPNAAGTDVSGLIEGTYKMVLTVTDDDGAQAADELYITVNAAAAPPPNQAPTAKSGASVAITLPTNSVTLRGSATDADGSIASWTWSKVSGPAGETIKTPNAAATDITGLVEGTYTFRLTVTDDDGATASDNLTVTVNAATAVANKAPVAQSGVNQSITLPNNTVTLKGAATDTDGSITTWSWTKVAGPAGESIKTPGGSSTDISGLVEGTYTFRLTVTDDKGAKATDDVQITVNAAAAPAPNKVPTVNAGADIAITLPVNYAKVTGTASDVDGSIASYTWTKVSGPAGEVVETPNAISTVTSSLVQGTYVFRCTVTDNNGAKATDDVQVIVNAAAAPPANKAPTANAGADITITLPVNSAKLSGTATDADGSIIGVQWSVLTGAAGTSFSSSATVATDVSGLSQGSYTFRLTVKDNKGATAYDDIKVTVNAAPAPPSNVLPTVNAGANITITLPVNYAKLTGTANDADGSIASYSWTKLSGPANEVIETPGTISTMASSLVQGTYQFRLTVTDNKGAKATDDVQVIVNAAAAPPANKAPTANAGADITITLPVNSAKLSGTATDADGSIIGVQWSVLTGAAGTSFSSSATVATDVSGLSQGSYTFRLTVKDNKGATAYDDVKVIVNAATATPAAPAPAAPAPNKSPVANAGTDVTIEVPVNNSSLNGSGSTDPDGTIASWSWTFVKGPGIPSIANGNTSAADISGMDKQGDYEFELTVTDDKGATAKDRVIISVVRINKKPIAQTKQAITVYLPVQSAELDASDSYDPDGNIATYNWKYVSGPQTPRMLSPDKAKSIVTDLIPGDYNFEVTVTDNEGEVTKATMLVSVKNSTTRRLIPEVKLYPNPATSNVTINIETPAVGRTTVTIYDVNGSPVLTEQFVKTDPSFNKSINISKLPKGNYMLMINVDVQEKVVKKLIKL